MMVNIMHLSHKYYAYRLVNYYNSIEIKNIGKYALETHDFKNCKKYSYKF